MPNPGMAAASNITAVIRSRRSPRLTLPPSVGAAGGPNGKAGCLQLTDPRPAAMMITLGPSDAQFLERREVCPTEGLLVLFPSWLSHSVTRLGDASAGDAVAFNVHGAEV